MQYLFELEIVNCVFTVILSNLIGPWSILFFKKQIWKYKVIPSV